METAPIASQAIPSTYNSAPTQSKLGDELSFIEQYAMGSKPAVPMDTQTPVTPTQAPLQTSTQMPSATGTQQTTTQAQTQSNALNVTVSFHKI